MAQVFNPSTRKAEVGESSEFKASLANRENSRLQREILSQKKGWGGVIKINVKLFLKRTYTNGKQIHKNRLSITKQRNSKRNHKQKPQLVVTSVRMVIVKMTKGTKVVWAMEKGNTMIQ